MSVKRKYRMFSPEQETVIVPADPSGDRTVREICREHENAESLYHQWRDRLLKRAFGRKTYELEVAGKLSRDRT